MVNFIQKGTKMTEDEKKTKIRNIANGKWWIEKYLMNTCNVNTRWIKRSRENVKKRNPELCEAIEECY